MSDEHNKQTYKQNKKQKSTNQQTNKQTKKKKKTPTPHLTHIPTPHAHPPLPKNKLNKTKAKHPYFTSCVKKPFAGIYRKIKIM